MYGNRDSRSGNSVSGSGNKSEAEMTSIALQEAIRWNEELMNREFRGRGDKDYMIRYRLSEKTGVPESYLFRLKHKSQGMKDVAGEYYRRLKLYYERACEANEEAADRYRAERLGSHHETIDQKPASAGKGVAVPSVGKASKKKA
jgi:hypothetical protein